MVDSYAPKDPRNSLFHKYNPFSRALFCWLDALIFKGFRTDLTQDDLYAHPSEADSKYMLDKFNKYWSSELGRAGRPRLWWTLARCLSYRIFIHAIMCCLSVAFLVGQALILGYLTNYFAISDPTSADIRDAYLFAMGLTLMSFTLVFFNGITQFIGFKLGMLVRIIVSSALYQKILKLNQSTVSQLTIGHIVNLASNDVHRFDMSLLFYHYIWIAPIHLTVATYFIYVEIGPTAFLAAFLVVMQIPLQYVLGRLFINLRLKAAKFTDKRIVVMNEIISGIRVIKMYGWEYAFNNVVTSIRKKEFIAILKSSLIRCINLSYYSISLPTIMFAVFSVYVSIDDENVLSPKKVFTTFSLLNYVRLISLTFMLKGVIQLAEGRVALKRISNFLSLEELKVSEQRELQPLSINGAISHKEAEIELDNLKENEKEEVYVQATNLSATWSNNSSTLTDISFKVDKSKPLLAVVGPVGAGKSTLLQCLLSELPATEGDVVVKGSVAYSSQEPWIFSATLKDNVLFGLPYDSEWYHTVMEVCALDKDIDVLPNGDLTLVGERGVTLSGGQKARVSLARAVYSRADIYLLDDPLSAVDAVVSRHIFDKCIRGLLSTSIVILVTHQVQYLQQCDQVLGLAKGCVSVYGDPNELLSSDSEIFELIDKKDDENKEDNPRYQFAVRKNSMDVTNGRPVLSGGSVMTPFVKIEEETYQEDELNTSEEDTLFDIRDEKLIASKSLTFLDDEADLVLDDSTSVYSAPPLSPPALHNQKSRESDITPQTKELAAAGTLPQEERAQGTISIITYLRYFVAGGGYIITILIFLLFIFTEGNIIVVDWWISDWADCDQVINSTQPSCNLTNDQRIGIYSGLLSSLWISSLGRSFTFYMLLLNAARVLHNRMFQTVLRTPILFFDTNPIGRVLNRFSKDVGFLDDILIFTFCEFMQLIFRFFGIMITAAIANPYIIIVIVVICVIFILFRWYYLRAARDVKRLEALARSPVYSHISMSLQGLCTIRAYGAKEMVLNQFHCYQNKHTQAWYLYITSSRWFGMRVDAISSIFVGSVAFISIPLANSISPGLIGLALSYAISLNGMFQFCIRQSAEVESYMISTERVIAYSKLESEASLETIPPADKPSKDWPHKGKIELKDVSYRHSSEGPLVLKGITCNISPGEKVGIIGRTGAGKSSLIAAIFRLAEPNGSITIDDVDCLPIGLHDLRSNISIIPQDPVLFTGTIRYNLDPFDNFSDERIWRALEQVQLKHVVENLEGGLEAAVTESGSNFSVGQRQLFCLSRALLRNNVILMLDEATANVDLETDAIVQKVIREQFSHCTVLTIAHRLDTVMDSDRIMVLRFGQLVEFGEPHQLMMQPDSYLLRLVEHTGPLAAQKLKNMALESYEQRRKE